MTKAQAKAKGQASNSKATNGPPKAKAKGQGKGRRSTSRGRSAERDKKNLPRRFHNVANHVALEGIVCKDVRFIANKSKNPNLQCA